MTQTPEPRTVLVVEDEDSLRRRPDRRPQARGLPRAGRPRRRRGARPVRRRAARPRAARRDAAEGVGHRRVPRAAVALERCRSSWSRPRAPRSTPSSASRSAPTTTSPSPTACASWSPACGPCCAARRPTSRAGARARGDVARGRRRARSTPSATRCVIRGEQVSLPLKEFELLGPAARERRPGAHPRHAHRPGVGRRLRRRHQDARRAHQAAARQGRGRPADPTPHRHHPRPRLQVRGAPRGLSADASTGAGPPCIADRRPGRDVGP